MKKCYKKILFVIFVVFFSVRIFAQNNSADFPSYKEINSKTFSNKQIADLYFNEKSRAYIVEGIKNRKIDVNMVHDERHDSFLRYCSNYDTEEWLELSKLILENGGNINKEGEDGKTPFGIVIQRCKINHFNLYLNYKPDWKKYDYFSLAINSGIFCESIVINEDGTVSDYYSDKIGMTLANFLISQGQNINKKDKYGMTPLHNACVFSGKNGKSVVYYLIAHGADVNLCTKNKQTPLYLCVRNIGKWNPEIVEFLLKNGVDTSKEEEAFFFILNYALSNLNETAYSVRDAKKIACLCCEYNVSGTQNLYLGFALQIGYMPLVEKLLETDDTIKWDSAEESFKMIKYAICSDKPEIVRLVLSKNPKLTGKDSLNKENVMMTAVDYKNPEITEILLKAGADPNEQIMYDYSYLKPPLVRADNVKMVEVLLENGANPNLIYDSYWQTTIAMEMASNKNNEIIQEILKYADLHKTSKEGKTIYDFLKTSEKKDLYYAAIEQRYVGKKLMVKESYSIRASANSSGSKIVTLGQGARVKVAAYGKYDSSEGDFWLKVEVLQGSKDIYGNAVKSGTTGWCLGRYLE